MSHMTCLEKDKSERLMVVSVLSCLYESQDYGYQLLMKLSRFGMDPTEVLPATLYRVLRKLEAQELIASHWADSSQGPKQRHYRITDKGQVSYRAWLERLSTRKQQIQLILDAAIKQGVIA